MQLIVAGKAWTLADNAWRKVSGLLSPIRDAEGELKTPPPARGSVALGGHEESRLCYGMFPKCSRRDASQVVEYAAKVRLIFEADLAGDSLDRVARSTQ